MEKAKTFAWLNERDLWLYKERKTYEANVESVDCIFRF